MTPMPAPTVMNATSVPRKVLCSNYGSCLDTAVNKGWEGFSCEKCYDYQSVTWDREQWIEDNMKCMALIYVINKLGAFSLIRPGNIIEFLEVYRKQCESS
jgi:hypothetical protein